MAHNVVPHPLVLCWDFLATRPIVLDGQHSSAIARRQFHLNFLGFSMLEGTIRDHVTQQRRPFLRFFACQEDLSHDGPDTPLPDAVATGSEPLLIVGAIAGG